MHSKFLAEYKKEIAYRYAIVFKAINKIVGYISVTEIDEEDCSGDLRYGIRKEFWDMGIATEAAKAVLNKLKDNGFHFATATHDINNPISDKVMQKLGKTDKKSYKEQWQPKNIPVIFKLYQIDFKP